MGENTSITTPEKVKKNPTVFDPSKYSSITFWRACLIEIPVFFLINLAMEHSLFGKLSAWHSITEYHIPHPYWLGIVLFGFVYGVVEGTYTGAIAAFLVVFLSPDSYGWNPMEWGVAAVLPVSFFIAGTLVGIVQALFLHNSNLLSVEKKDLTQQVATLDSLVKSLTKTNLEMEKRIVSRWETFQTLYEIAEKLTNLELVEILHTIPEMIAKYSHATMCSFFLFENYGDLRLKSSYGWPSRTHFSKEISLTEPVAILMLEQKKTTVIEPLQLEQQGIDAFFILVLMDPEGNPLGIIRIEEIDFLAINPDTKELLSVLANWMAQAIYNGIRYTESESSSLVDSKTKLIKETLFWSRTQKIITTAVRQTYDVSMMLLYIDFTSELEEEVKSAWLFDIAQEIKGIYRSDDEFSIADADSPYQFLLMCPFCNKEAALPLIKKINLALLDLQPKIEEENLFFCFEWDLFSLRDGSLFLSEKARIKLQFF